MADAIPITSPIPSMHVDVHEPGVRARRGTISCKISENLQFSTAELSSYCFADWETVVFDALLVAACVEFCDRSLKRPNRGWTRAFDVRVPVHDPDRWNQKGVRLALIDALSFLTGDQWSIEFVARKRPQPSPVQSSFVLPNGSRAIIPFSEGMDSRAVAGLAAESLGDKLIRVRLGSRASDFSSLARYGQAFASVPYRVRQGERTFAESSARSRGFKFATISGVAAYLAKADQVIVPESGQGALGPALVPVGQTYEDYRNHPWFTDRMERYFDALLHYKPRFEFPRLWHTKGETLRDFVHQCKDGQSWESTWSCWQSARQVSVAGRKRQCGICAACMLRRQSVHAAGLTEALETYVWENLAALEFAGATARGFGGITGAQREYAIAGVLHLDHLAAIRSSATGEGTVVSSAFQLGKSRNLSSADAVTKLSRLLEQHEDEWRHFVHSLGPSSFIAAWAAHVR